MKREIKFRGRRKHGEEWIYGDLNHIDDKVYIFERSPSAPLNSPYWFEVDPETVGQATGLPDKHGVDIYEGDMVMIDGDEDKVSHVYFVRGAFYTRVGKSEYRLGGWNTDSVEIVGHIHQSLFPFTTINH